MDAEAHKGYAFAIMIVGVAFAVALAIIFGQAGGC